MLKRGVINFTVLLLVLSLLILRIFLYFSEIPKFPDGSKVRISAKVASEPVEYSDSLYLRLMGYKVYLPLYPRIYYGDRIIVEGIVDGEKLKSSRLVDVQKKGGILYQYRQKLITFYERNLPKDHAALVGGMTIGSKGGIGENLWNALKNSGTAHVVVASGMNISLISRFLLGIFILFLPRRRAIVFALLGIWLYALVSGFDAPIVRASVMGSVAFLAVETGRIYLTLRSLAITMILMLLVKPVWVGDLGFWLSAVATASIVVFTPKFNKIFAFVPIIIKEDWVTTTSAQVGVVPLLYIYFGQFNILSPLVNVAVLWTVVPVTIIGIVSGIVGTIFEPLGRLLLLLTYPLTGWFLFIINLFN
jgi:competence protein ComEC